MKSYIVRGILISAVQCYCAFYLAWRAAPYRVPKPSKSKSADLPANNTVKLTEALRIRVANAMQAGGFAVWSEYCRVALTEKCQAIERELRQRDPAEFSRIYDKR